MSSITITTIVAATTASNITATTNVAGATATTILSITTTTGATKATIITTTTTTANTTTTTSVRWEIRARVGYQIKWGAQAVSAIWWQLWLLGAAHAELAL